MRRDVSGASGWDRTTYALFLRIPNDRLCRLFNCCIELRGAPRLWLITVLIEILKVGKDARFASSYRLIGLESCILKMLTLLIDERLQEWMEWLVIIPETQNGFRKGYDALNNPWILQRAIQMATAEKKTLYVVFRNLTNAFPWTNHGVLWSGLYRKGAGGPIFDWLRMLYRFMSYVVRRGDKASKPFATTIGILTGDMTSPSL